MREWKEVTFSALARRLFAVIKTYISLWYLLFTVYFVSTTWCWTETALLACVLGLRTSKYVHCS